MGTLLLFLCLWATMVPVTVVVFVSSEQWAVHTRGVDYVQWVQNESSTKGWGLASSWRLLYRWPLLMGFMLKAFSLKRTAMEHAILVKQEKLDREAKKQWCEDNLGKWIAAMNSWEHKGFEDQGHVFLYNVHYTPLVRKSEPSRMVDFMPTRTTHTVIHAKGGEFLIVYRAMPNDEQDQPYGVHRKLEGAKALCEQDKEWIALCAPGMEAPQQEAWKIIEERLSTADGLDDED